MTSFSITFKEMENQIEVLNNIETSLNTYISAVDNILFNLAIEGTAKYNVEKQLKTVEENINKLISNVACVSSVLLNAIYQYKLSEGKVIAKKTDGSSNYSYSQQNDSFHNTRNGVTYKGSYDFANIETDYGIKAKLEKDKRALEASADIKATLLKGKVSASGEYGEVSAEGDVGASLGLGVGVKISVIGRILNYLIYIYVAKRNLMQLYLVKLLIAATIQENLIMKIHGRDQILVLI